MAENSIMTDAEFELLCRHLRDTARSSAPPDEEAGDWIRALDTAGGPDRWYNLGLFRARQTEIFRRFGVSESD